MHRGTEVLLKAYVIKHKSVNFDPDTVDIAANNTAILQETEKIIVTNSDHNSRIFFLSFFPNFQILKGFFFSERIKWS